MKSSSPRCSAIQSCFFRYRYGRSLKLDSQGDFMTAADIKISSQNFMKAARTRNIDVNHSGVAVDAFIAESMLSKGGDFPEGSWVITTKIEDPQVWEAVQNGTILIAGCKRVGTGPEKTNPAQSSIFHPLDR